METMMNQSPTFTRDEGVGTTKFSNSNDSRDPPTQQKNTGNDYNDDDDREDELLQSSFRRLIKAVESKGQSGYLLINEKDVQETEEDGELLLKEFMSLAGEPITWVEQKELWNDLNKTNNSKFPKIAVSLHYLAGACKQTKCLLDLDPPSRLIAKSDRPKNKHNKNCEEVVEESTRHSCTMTTIDSSFHAAAIGTIDHIPQENVEEADPAPTPQEEYSKQELQFIAKGIKHLYSIRLEENSSELKFILASLSFLWGCVGAILVAGVLVPDANLGRLTWQVFTEAIVLFLMELAWECFLSWVVLRYDIKINYTRKLGNLFKIPKYFLADFLPFYSSTALSMTASLAINQTIFCSMYYRKSRERFPFCSYVFLSQDRREDRPDTLTFQVTEDIMRFIVYIPFKLLVANPVGFPAIIFIPITINNIGDGLAEPVGVMFGKHKYTTTALYYKGKFWNGSFTRSFEGSSCVFLTSLVVIAANYQAFPSSLRFGLTMALLPLLMTIAEAKAPHTNDGPFLALIGCGFLSAVFLL